jgi:competence protein ComEC
MRHGFPLVAASLLVGVAGGVLFDRPYALALSLVMSAGWATALLAHLRGYRRLQLGAFGALVMAAGWLLGAHAIDRAIHAPLRQLLEERVGGFAMGTTERRSEAPVTIEGRILADAVLTDEGALLRVDVMRVRAHTLDEDTSGGVLLGVSGTLLESEVAEWRAGRVIRASAWLRRPARYLNTGLPDQERVLARRGTSLVGTIKSAALVQVVTRGRWWEELAAGVRHGTRTAIARHVLPHSPQAAAIATAILIGDRAGLSRDTEQRLQQAGTYHVIAISGGNIAILAAVLLGGMAVMGWRGRVATMVVIAGLASYGLIAAGGASVLRATLMAVLYLAVRLLDHRTAPSHAIGLSATVIVLFDPLQIVDVGFWFTFGATIALVSAAGSPGTFLTSVGPTVVRAHNPLATSGTTALARLSRRAALSLWLVLAGTIAVELALAPIAAFVFQRVTVAGLVLNFAALPAMTVVQLGAFGVVAADLLGLQSLGGTLGVVVHAAAVVLVDSARLLDLAPWLTWRVPPPLAPVVTLYYICLGVSVALSRTPYWSRGVPLPTVLLFAWIVAAPDARVRALGDGKLHVSMIDVGQGDCISITFPNGRHLLLDSGGVPRGDFDIGDRVVAPTLRSERRVTTDYLAITHADADHIGGASTLLRDFEPHEVWWGVPVARDEATRRLRQQAHAQRVGWRTLQRGDRIEIGDVEVVVHHPPPPDWERQRVRNNDSLVIELRFLDVSVLLAGDVERDVEQLLAPSLDLRPVVVLKVAHHGSATSTTHEFLRVTRPNLALIGVGRANAYGHPAPHVLGRLRDAGAEIFRTDLDGQITVTTDGHTVWTRAFTGRTDRVGF